MAHFGHPGVAKTLEQLTRGYWWLLMKKDVERYIRGCSSCQMLKTSKQRSTSPLQSHSVPEGPWHTIALDLIGPLPESNSYDAILTVIDKYTKKAFFLPTTSTITSLGIAKLY